MIPAKSLRTNANPQMEPWRRELAEAVCDLDELLNLVGVAREAVDALPSGAGFPLRVPRPYIARMRRGDPDDPLLRQVLPIGAETVTTPGYQADPLREAASVSGTGVLQKYRGRALIIAAGACPVNCRYCFRRHFPYAEHRLAPDVPSLEAVRRDPSITEVILSGGEPLLLTDAHLGRLLDRIAAIDHVRRIRIHSRMPVVIPQRVTPRLVDVLTGIRPQVVIVTHFNHPNEIDDDCTRAMGAMERFTRLNQSVLLRGVNDDGEILVELSERLFAVGVLPYYLHMPDAVAGTAHFDVPGERALALHRHLAERLPGYLVPRLVREVPGAPAKELVHKASGGRAVPNANASAGRAAS